MVGRKVVGTQSLRMVIEGPGGGAMDLQAFSTLRQRGVRGGGWGEAGALQALSMCQQLSLGPFHSSCPFTHLPVL